MSMIEKYIELGYRIHPLREGSKKPIYKEWPEMEVAENDISYFWGKTRSNVGLICDGVTVVDFDTGLEKAREWYKKHREILKTITVTRRGIHAWFRSNDEKHGKHADGELRCEGKGYVVVPHSVVDGFRYEFAEGHPLVRPEELPLFQKEYVEWDCPQTVRREVSNVRAYIAKIESIQGEYGSKGLVRAAARCRDEGLSEAETMAELFLWNDGPTVDPPWSPDELARAVNNVFKKGE